MAAHITSEDALVLVQDREARNRQHIRIWLYVVLVVLATIVFVGGATRMTGSGLSITEWKPIHGIIPPIGYDQWMEEFDKYRQIPQYQQLNKGMSLFEFKQIFWWEWSHRFLARGVGFLVALPLAFFWLTGRLERRLRWPMIGILALGGLQGAVGWWMVASGLAVRVDVSQYRLATHLTLACIIFAAVMYVARGLAVYTEKPADRPIQRFSGWLVVLVFIQIYLGALVAGLDAGLSYNTWPLMDGSIIPGDMFPIQPIWHNFFENPKTVQFVHRIFAYFVFAMAIWHAFSTTRMAPETTHARRAVFFALLVAAQAAIGITTLLMQVPIGLGLLHQLFAIVLLGFAVAHWRATKGAYPLETKIVQGN
ncbi:cytochrome c oxidase assembly protein subunit 15 [Phyllobacterium ifriqiyense]|uniref:Heme A synthase n=1 Tax=Phyllobacterium ifriqiyense TaxID=314238 RepID=A0ABU0SDR9_9HYPH|nr:COX15/CtaA family protein [Phyllobacterium ifriqiyense]MDQ0998786.1 cytochrome c oxidase assembly protein subunit 15 [Phyllobacterium ifriqiyense]